MRLSDLIERNDAASRIEIFGLASDSREVKPGYLFAALAGSERDGATFIGSAIDNGAVAVLARKGVRVDAERAFPIFDDNPRRRFALIASRFFTHQPRTVVAVTGTNGKTSVAWFTRRIWELLGFKAGSVGTLGALAPDIGPQASLTTPEPVAMHRILKNFADHGIDHTAIEASSHGLAQHRIDGVRISAAAFTNLTRDHLDYHRDEEDYFYAKKRLFGEVMAPGGGAVINADSPYCAELVALCWGRGHRILTVGVGDADLRLLSSKASEDGQTIEIDFRGRHLTFDLPLVGAFQATNALTAAGLVLLTGGSEDKVFEALSKLEPVPGRLQKAAALPSGGAVFVDYAHTPDALSNCLLALRPHAQNRLSVVFGCGGDRDAGKRIEMGRIAAEMADRIFITDDNPRREVPATIRAAILQGCPGATEIADRREAIFEAVRELRAGDVLAIAGKGHEQGQIVGDEVRPFDDVTVAREAVAARGTGGRHGV